MQTANAESPDSVSNDGSESAVDHYACTTQDQRPSREYPSKVSYSSADIHHMLSKVVNADDLISNMKIVLQNHLLLQDSFFDDDVLLATFNGVSIHWSERLTSIAAGPVLHKREAKLVLGGAFAGTQVNVVSQTRCFTRRADPRNFQAQIPPHSYMAGFIDIRFASARGLLGRVRKIFGDNQHLPNPDCSTPASVRYWNENSDQNTPNQVFSADEVVFTVDSQDLELQCNSASRNKLPDESRITRIVVRVREDDHTVNPIQP
jgi:hypothetical protein